MTQASYSTPNLQSAVSVGGFCGLIKILAPSAGKKLNPAPAGSVWFLLQDSSSSLKRWEEPNKEVGF
jgi:hypothetical protein